VVAEIRRFRALRGLERNGDVTPIMRDKGFGQSPMGKKCKGMEDLVEEGGEAIEEDFGGRLMDADASGHRWDQGARGSGRAN
jgi:hypothetical protein